MYCHKRGKKWYYRIEIKDETGKRKRIERVGGATRQECERAYRAAMTEIDQTGEFSEPTNMTVAEYFTEWLAEYVEINLRPNTIRVYRAMIANHIIPALGEIKLRRVSSRLLQNFLNARKEKYSHGTLISLCSILKKSFAWAKDMDNYLRANPAAIIQVPHHDQAPKETAVFNPAQLAAIFEKFPPGHQFYMPVALAYHTGMRLGECLALTWQDIDMDNREIYIHATVIGAGEIQPIPKSKHSIRTIPFGQKLYKILKAEKARQAANKLKYGKHYAKGDLVCSWPDGSILRPDDLRHFGQFCKRELGAGSFHSLRHTHATMLLEGGASLEIVSKRLGHSSLYITAQIYSHILDRRKSNTVQLLDEVL